MVHARRLLHGCAFVSLPAVLGPGIFLVGALLLGLFPAGQARAAEPAQWGLCGPGFTIPPRPAMPGVAQTPRNTETLSDVAHFVEGGLSVLRGDVRVRRGTQQIDTDVATYDEPTQTITAEHRVEVWDEGLFLKGTHGETNLDTDQTTVDNASFMLEDRHGRGTAKHVVLTGKDLLRIRDGTYTTCMPGHTVWELYAGRLKLDKVTDVGTAYNVSVWFKDVPIFYSPFLTFPLSNKRKSGFLTPTVGSSHANGFEAATPYYWNIAPNLDETFTPRIMTNRGVLLGSDFRYLTPTSHGELVLDVLPHDTQRNDTRGLVSFKHTQRISRRWYTNIDFNQVSDKQYFQDLGTNIETTSTVYLNRSANLTYYGNGWYAQGNAQSYQTVDPLIPESSRPYARLPQLLFRTTWPEWNERLNPALNAQFDYFERGVGVTGARMNLEPSVSFPVRSAAAFFVPKLRLYYTQYLLQNQAAGTSSSISRALPTFTADSGVYFDRNLRFGGTQYIQTLEPRVYYVYTPYDNQADIPIFDTGLYTFSFDQLFRPDRFTGLDRIGDANRLTLALTSRILAANTGAELVRASIGQIRYFSKRKVTLPGVAAETTAGSDLVAEVFANLPGAWKVVGGLQWNPNRSRTDKASIAVRYQPDPQRVINVAYRFVRPEFIVQPELVSGQEIDQTDVSFHWPVTENWAVVGRWNYALNTGRSLEAFGGVEYESCCWALRAVARRYVTNTAGDTANGFFLQLELKGLAGIGAEAATFLQRNIPGYQNDF